MFYLVWWERKYLKITCKTITSVRILWLSILVIQTLTLAISLPHYIKGVNKIFLYILNNIEDKMINSLLAISLSWFFIIFLLNYIFVEGSSILTELIMLSVIIRNACYHIKCFII